MKQLTFIFIAFFIAMSVFAQNGDNIVGIWFNEEKTAKIEITKSSDFYSGKIVWLEKPTDNNGKPLVDKRNPSKEKQNKPIIGLEILSKLKYSNGEYSGFIYGPKLGKSGECSAKMSDLDNLRITVSNGLLSKTKIWTRVK